MDTKNLFESRRQIFKDAFYEPVQSAINSITGEYSGSRLDIRILVLLNMM